MSAISAYADSGNVSNTGSLGPYLQQAQPRNPSLPPWVTDKVGKYAGNGSAIGYVGSGIYSLAKGLSLGAVGANILFGTLGLGLFLGLVRLWYNVSKHYKLIL